MQIVRNDHLRGSPRTPRVTIGGGSIIIAALVIDGDLPPTPIGIGTRRALS